MSRFSDRHYALLIILTSIAYHVAIGIQGFDMADEGWSLTGFQQIFHDPESVEYLFLYYLTNIFGGLWNAIFGWGGIFSFRILTALVLALTAYVTWRMLSPYFNRWSIFLGIMASYLSCYYGMMVFYHNYLTALLSICAAAALLKALTGNNIRWMAACGFILGCNIFVRIPNITLTALMLLLIPYYIYNRNKQLTIKLFSAGFFGILSGIICVLLIMLILGHNNIFANAITSGFSAASGGDSTHNIAEMTKTYISVYKTIFTIGIFNNTYSIYLLGTLCWLWVVCSRRFSREYVYIGTIALIIMHTLPVGSDFGVANMGENCIYLAAPFITGVIWKEICSLNDKPKLRLALRSTAILFLILFFIRGGRQIMNQCYFDMGSRLEKTYRIDNPLATTFTTEKNCQMLNPLLEELKKYVRKDDYLLCFQNIPTLHYLTRTRPYLYNPWVWTYDSSNMERQFIRAEHKHQQLPVIVRDKSMIPTWQEYYTDWNNEHAEETYFHKNIKLRLINDFIQRNSYQVVWENEVFQILLPVTASIHTSRSKCHDRQNLLSDISVVH